MYYVIGPERSAETLARKVGLRRDEWKLISRLQDAFGRSFENDRVLVTHDAWQLSDYGKIYEYVEAHSRKVA